MESLGYGMGQAGCGGQEDKRVTLGSVTWVGAAVGSKKRLGVGQAAGGWYSGSLLGTLYLTVTRYLLVLTTIHQMVSTSLATMGRLWK